MKHCGTIPFQTERLICRRFTEEDTMEVFDHWASSPTVTRCLTWNAHETPETTRALLQKWETEYQSDDFYEWAVVEKSSGMLIGSAGMMTLPEKRNCCEVGYCFGEAWWNKGYATEILRALLEYASKKIGYQRVIAKHDIENPASGRVMQKAGMSLVIGKSPLISTEHGICRCYVYEYRSKIRKKFPWQ